MKRKVFVRAAIVILILWIIFVVFSSGFWGARQGWGVIRTISAANEQLEYFWYAPPLSLLRRDIPVLVVVPGLNGIGASYVRGLWAEFARKNGWAIISPSFLCCDEPDESGQERSYQYPAAWSGDALVKILREVNKQVSIDQNSLYLYGISAGAQFVHRFALWRPQACRAVAAFAPGSVSLPEKWVPAHFFMGVGTKDYERVAGVRAFVKACQDLGIDIEYQEYPDLGHEFPEEQMRKALEFFLGIKKENK